MTSSFLTSRQREDLNVSILQYLAASGLKTAYQSLLDDLGIRDRNLEDDVATYDGVLEKKWTAVVRLQKKSKVASLSSELDDVPSSSRKVNDATVWLPRNSKYTLLGHRMAITSIAFHPVFSILASGSEDTTVKIWDWELGELERTLKGHTKGVVDVDFGGRPGQELLVSCSSDLSIKLWDANEDYKNIRTLKGHDHTISCVRFFKDGEQIVSASRDNTLRIWAVKTGYCLRTITGHSDWIRAVAPSIDNRLIVSVGADQTARITDIETGECKLVIRAHDHVIDCCTVAPVSSYVYLASMTEANKAPSLASGFEYFATGSRDRTVRIWDARGNLIRELEGHDNWVRSIAFHPGGKFILSTGDDKTIKCWDLTQGGKCVRTIENAHDHFVCSLKWAPSIVTNMSGKLNASEMNGNAQTKSSVVTESRNIRCVVATASVQLDIKLWMA